jgi:hypothetical protein
VPEGFERGAAGLKKARRSERPLSFRAPLSFERSEESFAHMATYLKTLVKQTAGLVTYVLCLYARIWNHKVLYIGMTNNINRGSMNTE